MNYNFDEIIDRHNTDALKIERCRLLFGTENVLPLWVADMDFRTPECITDAIAKRLQHPILGYTTAGDDYFDAIRHWIRRLHGWDVEREWLGFLPGIVPGLAFAVNAFTEPHDEVVVQPPVYPPFLNVSAKNNRKTIFNPLKKVDGRFEMDFDDLERKITDRTRLFILCNPHNPGGRAWDGETLRRLAEICHRHRVLVVSDEIHSDLALPGNRHTPFATVSELAAQNSITYMAPSKTFNIAALVSASYIIPNGDVRKKFAHFLEKFELANGNIFAYVAAKAAYENGAEWLRQLIAYIHGNVEYVVDFLKNNVPQIQPMMPEASFLIWLDCTGMNLQSDDLQDFMVKKAGLGLNKGTTFGAGGEKHLRLNIACPRSVLTTAMEQLKAAVKG